MDTATQLGTAKAQLASVCPAYGLEMDELLPADLFETAQVRRVRLNCLLTMLSIGFFERRSL